MDGVVKNDDFLDLCQKYVELVEARERVVAHFPDLTDSPTDEVLADQLDDLDVQQRILMCRILFSEEQDHAVDSAERIQNSTVDACKAIEAETINGAERETGGIGRGRFALRELAVLLKAPFGKPNSRFG